MRCVIPSHSLCVQARPSRPEDRHALLGGLLDCVLHDVLVGGDYVEKVLPVDRQPERPAIDVDLIEIRTVRVKHLDVKEITNVDAAIAICDNGAGWCS